MILRLQDPRIWADPTTEPPSGHLLSSNQDYTSTLHSGGASQGRIKELTSEGGGDEVDSGEEEEDEYSDEYSEDDSQDYIDDPAAGLTPGSASADFLHFGNSLTVKGDLVMRTRMLPTFSDRH